MATRPLGLKPCGEAVDPGPGVLLMPRARDPWRGGWEVPGGFCEVGEHPALAAQRERREELGIAGRAIAYIGS